jgi:hypothetical protein
VAESATLGDDDKATAIEILRNMQKHYNEADFDSYQDDLRQFSKAVGDYSNLNAEPTKAKDPFREMSPGMSEEENYEKFLKHPVIGNLVDKYGRISEGNKQLFFNRVLTELDKTVNALKEHITAPKRLLANPTEEEFKKTAVEYFKELDEIIEKRIEYLRKHNPEKWQKYEDIYTKAYPVFKAAVEGIDLERANDAKKLLEHIPHDMYDFHKALSGIMPHLKYVNEKHTINVANAEAKENKKKAEEAKKLKRQKKPVEEAEETEEKPEFDNLKYDKLQNNLKMQLIKNIEGYKAPREETIALINQMINAMDKSDIDEYKYVRDELARVLGTKTFISEANDLFKYKQKA